MTIKQRKALKNYNATHEIKYPPLDDGKQSSQAAFLMLGIITAAALLVVAMVML